MKRKFTLVIVAALIVTASCKKLIQLADIHFSVPNTETVTVDGLEGNPPIPVNIGKKATLPPVPVPTNSEEYINQYNTSSSLIKEVVLGELNMEILEPSTQTFDLVDSLWLYISADGLPEILVAHQFNIPDDVRKLDLNTSEDNLKDYFLKETINFKIEGYFMKAPDSGTTFNITTRFDAIANPLENE